MIRAVCEVAHVAPDRHRVGVDRAHLAALAVQGRVLGIGAGPSRSFASPRCGWDPPRGRRGPGWRASAFGRWLRCSFASCTPLARRNALRWSENRCLSFGLQTARGTRGSPLEGPGRVPAPSCASPGPSSSPAWRPSSASPAKESDFRSDTSNVSLLRGRALGQTTGIKGLNTPSLGSSQPSELAPAAPARSYRPPWPL